MIVDKTQQISVIFIIMNTQQIQDSHKNKQQDSIDQFQQLQQEFLTYSRSYQLSPRNSSPKKHIGNVSSEKPKLKIIHTDINKKQDADWFLSNHRKQKKALSYNSKVIAIGNAIFRSNFQSGNIYSVQKVSPNTYVIKLNREVNSQRTSAWFYFCCEGLKGQNNFIIKGFTKTTSLYNQGMKICYREVGQNSIWRRGGTKISYTDSYNEDQNAKTQYQLRFTYFFKNSFPNSVQFAYCFPYTYTHLINFLTLNRSMLFFESLGKTYEGREIPLVTIGNASSNQVIVISARAHPGQTVGSLMMEGFLKELISDSQYSKNLRQAFLFKLVPMINPDGVSQGNYRFSAAGYDLNRKWRGCSMKMHPQVYLVRDMIKSINKQKKVIMYIDLHGHSRQKNIFFYGCCPKDMLNSQGKLNTKPKQFPFLMSKIHPPFRYDYCAYAVQKDKEGTARVTMWKQLGINYVYTLQASFCGSQGGHNYTIADYEKTGLKLCQGIAIYFSNIIKKSLNISDISSSNNMSKIQQQLSRNMNQFYQNPNLAQLQFEGNSSDSEPEAGEIPEQQRKNQSKMVPIQKYYKASKMLKFAQRGTLDDESKGFRDRLRKNQKSFKNDSRKSIKNQQNKQAKMQQYQAIKPSSKVSRRQIKTSNSKIHNYYVRTETLNKSINQKIIQLNKNKNHTEQNANRLPVAEFVKNKYQSQEIYPSERTQKINSKKKATSFQGAQYRRVRKLAEEHNKRNFSVQQTSHNWVEDETLIKGLIGMNNMLQINNSPSKQRAPSFFPNTTSSHYHKSRKASMQMHFRKQIKANDYTARRLHINGLQQQVKCFGRQIL